MSDDLHELHQHMLMIARFLLVQPDLMPLIREYERMDSVMPLLDPTGWRKIRKNIPGHLRIAKAIHAAQQTIRAELEASNGN